MKKVIYMAVTGVVLICLCWRCEVTEGFLDAGNAKYMPDSLVVKAVLDSVEDADRIGWQLPWQSTAIEGVSGTPVVSYAISRVDADNGYTEAVRQFKLVRKAVIELPYDHTLPVGNYVISVRISNDDHVTVIDSAYTVCVR